MIHEPNNLSLKQKRRIIHAQRFTDKRGQISCGHDFWDRARDKPPGDIFLCTACYQYFAKMNGLPWWIDGGKNNFGSTVEPHSNHLVDTGHWYQSVKIRLQDANGNSIRVDPCNVIKES